MSEPYYNEAGYEKQKGSQQGHENSRMYNEMALLKMVQVSGCFVKLFVTSAPIWLGLSCPLRHLGSVRDKDCGCTTGHEWILSKFSNVHHKKDRPCHS